MNARLKSKLGKAKMPESVRASAETPYVPLNPSLALILVILLLLILAGQSVAFIAANSQTNDEAAHIGAGYSYLLTGDFRLNPEHPPLIKEICAIPLLFMDLKFPWGQAWDQGSQWSFGTSFVQEQRELIKEQTGREGPTVSNNAILFWARIPVLVLSVILGVFLYRMACEIFGVRAGLLALSLYVLDPNIVAHSNLVTTDLGVTLFIFLAVYLFWRYLKRPAPLGILWLGMAVGAAAASKYSAIWLLPILAILALFVVFSRMPLPERPWLRAAELADSPAKRLASISITLALVLIIGLLVVSACYFVKGLPVFFEGARLALTHVEQGHDAFLMGEFSKQGWWYYFLVAFALKTPIGTLILLGLAFCAAMFRSQSKTWEKWRSDGMFLAVPAVAILVFTAGMTINIGLRHLLPLYPFLFCFMGQVAEWRPNARARRLILSCMMILCLAWNAAEAATIFPYHLSYFNQIAGGPDNGFRYVTDSNADWGQSAKALKKYVEQHNLNAIYCAFGGSSDPWYYGVRYQYVPGAGNLQQPKKRGYLVPDGTREILAISVRTLQGLNLSDHQAYAWLERRAPLDIIAHSILIYDISGDEDAHLHIAYGCAGYGLYDLARYEARRVLRFNPQSTAAAALLNKLAGNYFPN
jgi:4-amino-4-deoxy-L-arabinose transferase-like glycosyltransferase